MYFLKPGRKFGATKVYTSQLDGTIKRVSSYNAGKFFDAYKPFGGINGPMELDRAVKAAAEMPDSFIIRGRLRNGGDEANFINRRYKDTSENPQWEAVDRRWMMIDIDGLDLPGFIDPYDEEGQLEAVQYAKSLLPDWLANAGCTYHWSSSAGLIKVGDGFYEKGWDTISLHLWFWLDRAVCDFSIRKYLKKWRKKEGVPVDPSPFNPVQPHYTADPIFRGMQDVLERRSGYLSGDHISAKVPSEIVGLEEWHEHVEELQRRRKAMVQDFDGLLKGEARRYVRGAIKNALNEIKTAGKGQRHFSIFGEAAGMAELARYMDNPDAVKAKLVQVGQSVLPPSRHAEVIRTVEDGWNEGLKNPREIPTQNFNSSTKVKPGLVDLKNMKPVKQRTSCGL